MFLCFPFSTANCEQPNPVFDEAARRLYPILRGEQLDPGETVRAGVSAMGFGGINTHATVESAGAPSPRLTPSIDERALLASSQDAEVLPLAAQSVEALIDKLEALAPIARAASIGEILDLAAHEAKAILEERAAEANPPPSPPKKAKR